jgi:hypothetical protein
MAKIKILFIVSLILSLSLVIGCQQITKENNEPIVPMENMPQDANCPILNNIPLNDWNPIMTGSMWESPIKRYNVNLDATRDTEGKMVTSQESRWKKYLDSQDLMGYEIVKDSGLNLANPNCWNYENKKGYNPDYNYCEVQLEKVVLDSKGNVKNVINKKLTIVFDHKNLFPINTTSTGGKEFSLWTFTNLTFVKSYCE